MIECVNPLSVAGWDAAIAHLPGATFFHGRAWAQVLHRAYGFSPCYLASVDAGRVTGLAALMEVDSWLTGRRGVGLPFSDHAGILADCDGVRHELEAAALKLGERRRWRRVEIRGTVGLPDATPCDSYFGHRLDLTRGWPALSAGIDSATRRSARKAERDNVVIETSRRWEDLVAFHGLLCETRRRHGVPPQPWGFFRALHEHTLQRNLGCVVLARHAGRPIAGAVFVHFGRTALYKFGASEAQSQHLRPNNLLFWRMIEWHTAHGFTTLDFGRTSADNDGLRRFKRSWGAEEYPLDYTRFDCRRLTFMPRVRGNDSWQTRAFRVMPEWAARLIGAAAYRHIA